MSTYSGRLRLAGGKNPAGSIEVDRDKKKLIDYAFRFWDLDDAEQSAIGGIFNRAIADCQEADVALEQRGPNYMFDGLGDVLAVMQVLLGVCEALGEFGLTVGDAEGAADKARKVKAKRQR